ncbi:unnamed protein product [Danaus chrysippus]|uniref:(African queen) hypothetical protein n=1 Tax=Danaus chrysippus TaxID=151541 RepID=A0A8J2R8Z7_9NEOP|nr:unnamed protein product [Danaus chrysippus]
MTFNYVGQYGGHLASLGAVFCHSHWCGDGGSSDGCATVELQQRPSYTPHVTPTRPRITQTRGHIRPCTDNKTFKTTSTESPQPCRHRPRTLHMHYVL